MRRAAQLPRIGGLHSADMASLDAQIDALYQTRFKEFITARTTLAKALSSGDASRVKALKKPALVPWAVNQVYWRARPLYDRLLRAGHALRSAQLAALKGRHADVRKP